MGNIISFIDQSFFLKASEFDPETNIPDLSSKVALVTGGYNGIGYYTVKALLKKNCTVIIAGRSQAKYDEALRNLQKDNINCAKLSFCVLDLADLQQSKSAYKSIQVSAIHLLFLNAGVMMSPTTAKTSDGFELQFGTNNLGHQAFASSLLPLLRAAAKDGEVRVIWTSSIAHRLFASSKTIEYNTLRDGSSSTKHGLYGQSKIGNVLQANAMDDLFAQYGIRSCSVHPGILKTDLYRHFHSFQQWFYSLFMAPIPMGALTQLYAATSATDIGKKHYIPWAREGKARSDSDNKAEYMKFWNYCENLIGG